MTATELDELRRSMETFSYEDENGIDLTLIDEMLRLTPSQRIDALMEAMKLDQVLTEARVKFYGSDPRTAVEAELGEG
jgi:hypothetical protein